MAEKLTTFSTRSNAKRAAEKAIADDTAPSIDYGLRTHEDGRIEIVWKTGRMWDGYVAEADERDAEIATATADAETPPSDPFARIEASEKIAALGTTPEKYGFKAPEADEHDKVAETPAEPITNGEGDMPDIFPPGTRVIVHVGARKRRAGAVDYRVDARSCRVKFDDPFPSVLFRYNQLSLDVDYRDGSEPLRPAKKPPRKPRAAPSGDRKPSRKVELDMRAATGAMPTKPVMTSKANPQYQKRFDQLEKWAMADDWDAVRGYEVKGINSYAKMVRQYRDRLLVAHEAALRKKSPLSLGIGSLRRHDV